MQSSNRRNENRQAEVSEISRNLKGLARELNVPVMALAQLSRTVETRQSKVPQLSDLRESGCLTGETPVYLPDEGIYRPIEQLVGQKGFRVLALNTETWKLEPRPVTNAFATGCKPVYKLTTRLGRTVRATANHKFLTIQGWKRLDELAPQMHIASLKQGGNEQEALVPIGTRFIASADLSYTQLHQSFGKRDQFGHNGIFSYENCIYDKSADAINLVPMRANVSASNTRLARGNWDENCVYDKSADAINLVPMRANMSASMAGADWDEIISIDPDGEAEVYDLTVDELHNFIAGDIIAHNSIEQDADIVMFIYRDDVYNPETERKNIADIIVAKHRNGPVGEVSLFFQASQTRFCDLEVSPPTEE